MNANAMTENDGMIQEAKSDREILERFERSKILEVYFSRIDGRIPKSIPESYQDLYQVDLLNIKNFLLGQHPHDTLLTKLFRIMH